MRGPQEGKKEGGRERREGGGGQKHRERAEEGRARGAPGPAAQLLSLSLSLSPPQLSREDRQNGGESTTYLGESGSSCDGCMVVFVTGLFLWAVWWLPVFPTRASTPSEEGAASERRESGTWLSVPGGLAKEMGDGSPSDPPATLSHPGLPCRFPGRNEGAGDTPQRVAFSLFTGSRSQWSGLVAPHLPSGSFQSSDIHLVLRVCAGP